MDKFSRLVLITFCCVMAQACAEHPTPATPAKPAVPATSAATAEALPLANPAPPSANIERVALNDKTLTQSEVNALLSQGYKPQKGHGDSVLYCRSESQLGSRFQKRVCLTGEQIKAAVQESKDTTRIMDRNLGNGPQACGAAKCN